MRPLRTSLPRAGRRPPGYPPAAGSVRDWSAGIPADDAGSEDGGPLVRRGSTADSTAVSLAAVWKSCDGASSALDETSARRLNARVDLGELSAKRARIEVGNVDRGCCLACGISRVLVV